MAAKIPFHIEEAVILLQALVEATEEGRNREEAIQTVSKQLNQRARNLGIQTFEGFRSISGIRAMMRIMETEYANGLRGNKTNAPPPRYKEAVKMFRENRPEFDALLQQALQNCSTSYRAGHASPTPSRPAPPPSPRIPEPASPAPSSPFSLPTSFPRPVSTELTELAGVLASKGYAARAFATKEEATEYLAGAIRGTTVAFGGSVTLRETGLFDRLAERNAVVWHWRNAEGKSAAETLREARNAAVYVSSVNAIAATGELVNIDGNGNRVAETSFGHERVYFVVGRNKLAPTLAEALQRAYSVAAPKNAARLNPDAPAPDVSRICRVVSVFNAAPLAAKYEVVLVDESLGY